MQKKQFLSYVLDERKHKVSQQHPFEVFFYNPQDVRGKPSSFVYVVLLGTHKDEIYCAGSKYNPYDSQLPKKLKVEFSLEEGLKQACNRVWREFNMMPSLYGKDHGPKEKPGKTLSRLVSLRTLLIRGQSPDFFARPIRLARTMAEARRKLLNAKPEGKDAAKKPAHS